MADDKFEYNVGVFNGEGEGGSNSNDGHLLVGRISFQPMGAFGYSEGDLKRGDSRWIFSLAGATNNDLIESNGDYTDTDSFVGTVGFRRNGIYLMGEYFWEESDTTDSSGSKSGELDAEGFYAQIGYTFPSMWDIAARYAYIDQNDDVDDDDITEFSLGFNKYFMGVGHSLKFSVDLSWLEEEIGSGVASLDDFRLRAQGQIVF